MNKGDVIIIPTDTVYGLATRLYDKEGLEKIYEMKQRDLSKPIPLLVSSIEQVKSIAYVDDFAQKVMERFWPGPLTLVMKTTDEFKQQTGEETIAIRMPNHAKALSIIERIGILRVTSLNESGKKPLVNREEIEKQFGSKVKAIFWDTHKKKSNLASTVAKVEAGEVDIYRQGAISRDDILSLGANQIRI